MKNFSLLRPRSLDEARKALVDGAPKAAPRGAGLDILDHLKEGLPAPDALVELRRIEGETGLSLRAATAGADGLELGALSTLSQLAESPILSGPYAALAEAAGQAATPSIRNMATLGGNLLQRPRCWYYRDRELVCLKKGGDLCLAISGDNRYHAILGGGPAFYVHPSSLATPAMALDARVRIHGESPREMPLDELFVGPAEDPSREHRLAPGEVLTHLILPTPEAGARSAYFALREKQSHDWPLVEAAVALRLEGGTIRHARIVLGHVAPLPWRASEAEAKLVGQKPSVELFARTAELALAPARPMTGNAYKVPAARGALRHALHRASGLELPA